jgi:REP element-mobilizing transposase RayT
MSSHVFHEIYLHFNWHTKSDHPLITPTIEPLIHQHISDRCRRTKGVYFHGIGGTATHLHLAVNIDPSICISDLVGEIKGASSHDLNKHKRYKALEWQRGFGVVSFGKRQLPWVLEYIARQKEHHAKGTIHRRLEATEWEEEAG